MQAEKRKMPTSRSDLGRRSSSLVRGKTKPKDPPFASIDEIAKETTADVAYEPPVPPAPPVPSRTMDPPVKDQSALYNERVARARRKRLAQTSALVAAIEGSEPDKKIDLSDLEAAIPVDVPDPHEEEEEDLPYVQREGKWYDKEGNEIKPKQVLRFMWGDKHYDIVLRGMRKVRQK